MTISPSCSFSFNIRTWHAVSSRMATLEQWQQWANGTTIEHFAEFKPNLAFLPAIQRRRLSITARLMCEAAWTLANEFPNCPLVYASHDGEINRSFELWLELLQCNSISPTSFGLSVHNALAGQWSILRGEMQESTALATVNDGLENTFAEAYALLAEGAENVLVIIVDEPLKTEYAVTAERAPLAYALALVLTQGENYRLTLTTSPQPEQIRQPYYGALDWIHFLLSGSLKQTRFYDINHVWQWEKQHGIN